ncbi:hypothetical protein EV200_104497 [Pedobacter psychrotolerans]|uniref:Uncharacterized protein n=1 Tax=Pedobacter psychrotolerans TaxID=1843235 RepID=A0A4R2HCI9_9SPHI|nr:hypothetical protein EV200_104497 [Pedobacter psychrotolerans]
MIIIIWLLPLGSLDLVNDKQGRVVPSLFFIA